VGVEGSKTDRGVQGRVQSKRASEREPGSEDLDRIEGEFRIKAALNVAGLSKAMLLAREQELPLRRSASTMVSAWFGGTTASSSPWKKMTGFESRSE
jgi:hypothetical protein